MNINKNQVALVIITIIISLNMLTNTFCYAYTSSLDSYNAQDANQLLRVSLEPTKFEDEINIYLFTSDPNPGIREQESSGKIHTIELFNTIVATTNNISLKKVADVISNVKILPFINTNNPLDQGLVKVVIDTKKSGLKFNIIVKPVKLKNKDDKSDKVTAKMYYPPKDNSNLPQSMALFTPLDEKTIAQLPPEELNKNLIAQNPDTMPEVPTDTSEKLTVSPPPSSPPPSVDSNTVQDLPDIGTPVSPVAPTNNAANNAQPGESPQPPPNVPTSSVKTIIPHQLAKYLTIAAGLFIAVLITIAYGVVRKMLSAKKSKPAKSKRELSLPPPDLESVDDIEGLEPIEEVPVEDLKAKERAQAEAEAERMLATPFGEEVEEVDLIDSINISDNKSLYLVKFAGHYALIGLVNEDVIVLNTFHTQELASIKAKIDISKEGTIVGKEIYHVKIGAWEAVLSSEENNMSIHSNLTV